MDLLLILIIVFIPLIANIFVKSIYNKYQSIDNKSKLSGFEVARKILDNNNLKDIHIIETKGNLTDHYDPTRKVIKLSKSVFNDTTISSMAIAAHECGHAIQDKEKYFFLRVRSFIYPIVNLGTNIAYIIILIGFIAELMNIVYIGIALVSLGLIFQLVTLPVEFNASSRALKEIEKLKIENNLESTKKVLTSAALTYIAGVLASALQILRLLLIARDN